MRHIHQPTLETIVGYKLILFDLDDTLIAGYMRDPERRYMRVATIPRIGGCLQVLKERGVNVGIVTNQGGVGLGYHTSQDFYLKLQRVYEVLGLYTTTPVAVCFAHKDSKNPLYNNEAELARRKPSGAMIDELRQMHGLDRAEVLYVGDSDGMTNFENYLNDDDLAAARNAGVDFMTAMVFWYTLSAFAWPTHIPNEPSLLSLDVALKRAFIDGLTSGVYYGD